jgi:hypothetical protein
MTTTNNTSPSGEELKPCPLCGSAARFFHIDDIDSKEFGGHGICCDTYACAQVGLMFACGDDPKPALAEIWNRRAADSTSPIGEDAANGATAEPCIAPACHQWDGTDTCTCRALLLRAQKALPVLSTVLSTAGLAGASIADDLLADVNAALTADGALGERDAFEAWLNQGNRSGANHSMWKAWQARAALPAGKVAAEPVAPVGGREAWEKVLSFSRRIVALLDTTDVIRSTVSGTAYDAAERAVFIRNIATEALSALQPAQPTQAAQCSLGCGDECKADLHGCLSECPSPAKRRDLLAAHNGGKHD